MLQPALGLSLLTEGHVEALQPGSCGGCGIVGAACACAACCLAASFAAVSAACRCLSAAWASRYGRFSASGSRFHCLSFSFEISVDDEPGFSSLSLLPTAAEKKAYADLARLTGLASALASRSFAFAAYQQSDTQLLSLQRRHRTTPHAYRFGLPVTLLLRLFLH